MATLPVRAAERSHRLLFLVLNLPFGISTGYVTVTLAYQLSERQVGADRIGTLVALYLLPQTWKFLWAPVVDKVATRRMWYVLGALLTGIGIAAIGSIPAAPGSLQSLLWVLVATSVASSIEAMAAEGLMAYATPEARKGRAGGWYQAGNLGGLGLGGGAGLWLAEHVAAGWVSGVALGLACVACCAAPLFVAEPQREPGSGRIVVEVVDVLRDVWAVARSRRGFLGLLIVFLPIGTGAASNLFAAIADDWHASADRVALVTGAIGGLASAAGCLIGGHFCDRMPRQAAYAIYGAVQAAIAVAMALAPRTPDLYVVFTLVYALANGLAYAAFSAVTLEAMGLGSAATKYNVYASMSNMPIAYLTAIEGWSYARRGSSAMLVAEAGIAVVAIAVYFGAARWAARLRRA